MLTPQKGDPSFLGEFRLRVYGAILGIQKVETPKQGLGFRVGGFRVKGLGLRAP